MLCIIVLDVTITKQKNYHENKNSKKKTPQGLALQLERCGSEWRAENDMNDEKQH